VSPESLYGCVFVICLFFIARPPKTRRIDSVVLKSSFEAGPSPCMSLISCCFLVANSHSLWHVARSFRSAELADEPALYRYCGYRTLPPYSSGYMTAETTDGEKSRKGVRCGGVSFGAAWRRDAGSGRGFHPHHIASLVQDY